MVMSMIMAMLSMIISGCGTNNTDGGATSCKMKSAVFNVTASFGELQVKSGINVTVKTWPGLRLG